MSIFRISQIGDWLKKNQGDIAIVVGFVLVALIAFGAGRLSAPEIVRHPIVIEEPAAEAINVLSGILSATIATSSQSAILSQSGTNSKQGLIVASKNGKKYHWPWSSGAKNIKPENQVWFQTEQEAQAAGYSKSANFDQDAPVGYKQQ